MTKPVVECIANYSEARRPEVVEAIIQAIQAVPGTRLLDRHSDLDHNRSVLTFIGPPEAVEEAAFQSIAQAARLIDLDHHTGEHPRIGAADVVPFVPISGLQMDECVAMARRLGARVGKELSIPVYLYEEAATRPERQNLENIRRGQYETLKKDIVTDPERAPDFGPSSLTPAGATVIGARHPLVAYNVYLTTEDTSIAKKIARAVRFSSGGLRYVKALDMLVDGRAQVSMNLTNYRGTPIARVVEMIRREAQRYGVDIHHSELVGLVPQEALIDAAVWYLQLDQFEPGQILEQKLMTIMEQERIEQERLAGPVPAKFLETLASASPTPGGGSAAAFTGAQAAALVAMVARLTIGKKKYAAHETRMQAVLEQAETLRREQTAAVAKDSTAFEQVLAALKKPKDTPEQEKTRLDAIQVATREAMQAPLEVARAALKTMELALEVVSVGNINAISDGGSGAALARAALTCAGMNVRINANSLKDQEVVHNFLDELRQLEVRAVIVENNVRSELKERGGLVLE